MKFQVGDRVKCIVSYGEIKLGKIGVIRCINDHSEIGVEFEDFNKGHNLNNNLPLGVLRGYFVEERNIEFAEPEVKLDPKERKEKILAIIKEIEGNKDYKQMFKSKLAIEKEVNLWNDTQICNWK